jgi:AcrR family transcriptional regulator
VSAARTREAILKAARQQFAAQGYERTTIRSVAAAASIDPSMVMRYFGSKEGLFAAASDIDAQVPDLRDAERERYGEVIVRHFLERWEDDSAGDALIFLLRAAGTNDGAAERMKRTFSEQIGGPIAAALDDAAAGWRVGMVGSHLLGIAISRYVLRLEPIASMELDELVESLAPAIQRYLTEPLLLPAGSSAKSATYAS